ncbi:MurR/RpiR family transcriptional regulator [Kiloniella laminariae]|uniref:MurR/RpiR family transcriptional regulator n=1 Tax=Kiloniella laminariae TaxID=454162 RepID=UPI0003644769|nr:MurR/RpiR family transcriptional regulator [Kiloniella laminariae]
MTAPTIPPATYEELRNELAEKHEGLSKRLKQIAEYALDNPNDMALETVSGIAERASVQPSSLIRFAKAFGYSGFSEMQRVFRSYLVESGANYKDRIRSFRNEQGEDGAPRNIVLEDFIDGGIAALKNLRDVVDPEQFEAAVKILGKADVIYLAAQRRAFPVASYLAYAFAQLDKRCVLVDGNGGMFFQQGHSIRSGDALLAISFKSYSPEVIQLVKETREKSIPVVSISDGLLSPLSQNSDVTLEVEEVEVHAFRSLSATMTLALTLVVALGRELQK